MGDGTREGMAKNSDDARVRPRGLRTVAVLALVALTGIGGGMVLSTRIISPTQAAADAAPPDPEPIAVPVERRVISNEVIARGDGTFADPQEITVMTGDSSDPAVVTGRVPEVGSEVQAGTVAMEVTGRPVIVLPGEIPTYRDLGWGMSGVDVRQLKAALAALGIDPGDRDSDVYDERTAEAVTALYAQVGYPAPTPSAEARSAWEAAQEEERVAEDAVIEASAVLAEASAGLAQSDRIELDTQVAVAEAQLAELTSQCALPDGECSQSELVAANGALAQARARRDEATAAPDISRESAALSRAQSALSAARGKTSEAKSEVLVGLPAAEVVMVKDLPRRIDEVTVALGDTVRGAVMSVSSAALTVQALLPSNSAALVAVGMPATTTVDGREVDLTVTSVGEPPADDATTETEEQDGGQEDEDREADDAAQNTSTTTTSGEVAIRLDPVGDLPADVVTALRGANVRVTIPVSSTGGEVLAVPLAALTSGPSGESRVSVELPGEGWKLVVVDTGLAAQGYVEIASAAEELEVGDRVLIGEATGS